MAHGETVELSKGGDVIPPGYGFGLANMDAHDPETRDYIDTLEDDLNAVRRERDELRAALSVAHQLLLASDVPSDLFDHITALLRKEAT